MALIQISIANVKQLQFLISGNLNFGFKCLTDESNLDKWFNNIIEKNDTFINTFDQKPNFNYYHNHQFHRLVNKLTENKTFSLLHTNICSLEGNFENFQNLISNLGLKLRVIAFTKTWTPNK